MATTSSVEVVTVDQAALSAARQVGLAPPAPPPPPAPPRDNPASTDLPSDGQMQLS